MKLIISRAEAGDSGNRGRRALVHSLGRLPDPATVFRELFGGDPFAFWIDREHASDDDGGAQSIMGSAATAGSEVLTYEVGRHQVISRSTEGPEVRLDGTILEVLRRKLARGSGSPDKRLEFSGGYVGYLGYELKADLGSPGRHVGGLPDACLIGASAFVVLDHVTGEAHAVRVLAPDENLADAEEEARRMRDELAAIGDCPPATVRKPTETVARPDLDADAYRVAIAEAQRRLRAGEAYEIA